MSTTSEFKIGTGDGKTVKDMKNTDKTSSDSIFNIIASDNKADSLITTRFMRKNKCFKVKSK